MHKVKLSARIPIEDITKLSEILRSLGNTVMIEDGALYIQPQQTSPVTAELFNLCRQVTDELSGYAALYEQEDLTPVETISLVKKSNQFLGRHFQ